MVVPQSVYLPDSSELSARKQHRIYEGLLDSLSQEAKRVSRMAGSPSRYTNVHVLLLQWEHDDLNVAPEVEALATVFEQEFRFQVENYVIPVNKPFPKLNRRLLDWTDPYDHDEALLIVYYAGHGKISDLGRTLIWKNRLCSDDEHYSELKWNTCEEIVQQASADKLFIFDCCHAADALSLSSSNGASETLCASGFESTAPVPGPHSFTAALVFVLRRMAQWQRPFSIAAIHSAVLAYLQALDPRQVTGDGRCLANALDHANIPQGLRPREHRTSPVHLVRPHQDGHQPTPIHIFPLPENPDFHVLRPEPQSIDTTTADSPSFPPIMLELHLKDHLTEKDCVALRQWLRSIPVTLWRIWVTSKNANDTSTSRDAPRRNRRGMASASHPINIRQAVDDIETIKNQNYQLTRDMGTSKFLSTFTAAAAVVIATQLSIEGTVTESIIACIHVTFGVLLVAWASRVDGMLDGMFNAMLDLLFASRLSPPRRAQKASEALIAE